MMELGGALGDLWSMVTVLNLALLVVGAIVAWVARSYYRFWAEFKIRAHIPGPPVQYPLGAAWVMVKHGREKGWQVMRKYGDLKEGIHRVFMPGLDVVMVTKKEHLRQILQVSSHHFWPERSFGDPGENWSAYKFGGDSVLFTDADQHEEWLRLRRLLGRAFVTTAIRPLVHPVAKVLDKAIDVIRSEQKRHGGKPLDFVDICNALTFDILGVCSFSTDFGALDAMKSGGKALPILEAYKEIMDQITWRQERHLHPFYKPKYLWIPTKNNRKLRAAHTTLWGEMDQRIESFRNARKSDAGSSASDESPDPNASASVGKFRNFMELLMEASDEGHLTTGQLRSNAVTILSAGHETTGLNLLHTLYFLGQHPEVQKKLQEEVDEVWPEGTEPDESTYRKLEYTEMVLKEALRLFPQPYLTIRTIPKDMNIGGYDFPKYTTILIHMQLAMRDPHNWEDPEAFKPERFSKDAAKENFYAWLPFMHGGRNCIGQRFAQMTTALTIAALVRRFEFTLPDDYEYKTKLTDSFAVFIGGMPLYVRERQNLEAEKKPTTLRN